MSSREHQDSRDHGQVSQELEPFLLDMSGPANSGGSSSGSGQFAGAEMEFEPFMFNPGEVEGAGTAVSIAPEPAPTAQATVPSPVPVTGHAVPPPSYLTNSAPAPQPAAEPVLAPTNGTAHPQSSPDLSAVMMGRSRGHTGPLAAERLGATPASWSDSSLASIEDFSAVLIAVQAGKKLLQSGPRHAALPAPVGAGAQATPSAATMEQPQGMDMGQVPQWAAQAGAGGQATVAPEAPPPFIAGADPSSPWATDQPEWASGASHAAGPSGAAVEQDDAGLPPWLTEEAETPVSDAVNSMPTPEVAAPEPTAGQAEDRPELVSSTFTGTTGVGIQAPESTLDEPALETDDEVAGALQQMDQTQSGGLDAEAIEFEGFMFDQGTPAPIPNLRGEGGMTPSGPMPQYNPAQAGPPGMVVDQDAQVEGESLPFWLNQAAEVQVTPGEGYVEASEAAARAGDSLAMDSAAPAGETDEDFADLPSVQPFDFTQAQVQPKDEQLGFNTEELIGMAQGERDPMVVTANLEALADLIGGPLPPGIAPRHPAHTPQTDGAPASTSAGDALHEPALVIPEEAVGEEPGVQPFDAEDMGWMSTVTTDLAASGLVEPTGALPVMPGAADSTGLSGDLGVSPFDINALDEEEESSTSMLDRTAPTGPNTDKLESWQAGASPETSPRMGEEFDMDAETATSIFAQPVSETAGPSEVEEPKSRLASEAKQQAAPETERAAAAPAPEESEQPGAVVFKARVARGLWSSNVPLVASQAASAEAPAEEDESPHSPWEGGQTGMSAAAPAPTEAQQAAPEAPAQAEAQAQAPSPVQEQEQVQAPEPELAPEPEPAFQMPRPGDATVSGPLPTLTGYEDLVALMEKNPQDIGSYMAMATAYVNSGEYESALRVYRRLIKRPGVSATLLGLVDEEMDDLKQSAGHMARYHQVRGDLYLKLGRHREAIEEYNKVV